MKQFLVLFVLLFTVCFTYTVVAQEAGSVRRNHKLTIPEKIHKLILDPLPAGTYSIGSGGYFPTIDSAFNKLSIDGIAGEVVLELTDALYTAPSGSSFIMNGPINGAGSSSRVTIRPADNVAVTINGDGEAVLLFYDVSYLTIDGITLQGSPSLKVHAFYNSTGTQWNDAFDFYGNCDYVQVKNLTASSDDVNRFSGAILFQFYNQSKPDSGLISGVFIPVVNIGIYLIGNGTLNPTNFVISNNHIGSPSDSLIVNGIENESADWTIIENNHIENMRKGFLNGGIYFVEGINSYISDNVIIRNNVIHNIAATNSPTRAQGIFISAGGQMGENNCIYNNIVYDIRTYVPNLDWLAGIFVHNTNPKVDYNTVWLSEGNDVAPTSGSSAIYIYPGTTTPTIRNNILINTRNDEPYSAVAARYAVADVSDYNDLYVSQFDHSFVGSMGGTFYKTLSEWQATGKDLNSITEMPNFISPFLHIDETVATNLESGATPIYGITTDFDGDTRHASTPDIGADEFDGFNIGDPLPAGTYTIGTGGYFATIQDAFNKLETDGVAGNVTLELIDELYTAPTDSFGFKLNGPISGAGPNSRVTIKPAENKNVVIEGNGLAVLYFLNTSYVTFDGVSISGSTTLTVHTYENNQFEYNLGLFFIDNSDHNIIQNSIFINDDILRRCPALGVSSLSYTTATPDSNLIQSNFVKKAGIGIYVSAYYSTNPVTANSNIIRKNIIGSESDTLISWGIQVERNQNAIIEDNVIEGIRGTSTDFVIAHGIGCWGCSESTIRNNVIHNVNTSYTGGSMGIALIGYGNYVGNGNLVYNNMVYDINSSSNESYSNIGGIHLEYQNNTKVYYNSVYLSGKGANHQGSGAFYIFGPGSSNSELKNNIFVNTRDESPYCASAIYLQTASSLVSDYNDLYYDDINNNNCLVRIAGTDYLTLANWQATGKDSNSVTEMPNFVDPYLHIVENEETLLESRGIPVAGINIDFDGQTRHATTPDIGADEFDGIAVGVDDEETLPTKYALEQNYPNPFNPSTKIEYSIPQSSNVVIKVFDILGNEIATLMDEEKSVGTYELTWNAANLSSGIYFYQLKAGDYVDTKKMILIK